MTVKRIVANIATDDVTAAQHFYRDIFGLDLLMDLGWIRTYGSDQTAPVQISVASEGGNGAPVPDFSIEVDNIDSVLQQIQAAKMPLEYPLTQEPWGVSRFFIRDPFGKLINVMQHH